jgi:hypothetical protein
MILSLWGNGFLPPAGPGMGGARPLPPGERAPAGEQARSRGLSLAGRALAGRTRALAGAPGGQQACPAASWLAQGLRRALGSPEAFERMGPILGLALASPRRLELACSIDSIELDHRACMIKGS